MPRPSTRHLPLGRAYAATQVNAAIFRVGALASFGKHQYVAYYGPRGEVVVGKRALASDIWQLAAQPFTGNVRDAHNVVVLGISSDGLIHLAYDHHGDPLHYRVSIRPEDIGSFGPEQPMTGRTEGRVTYPQFVTAPDGTLLFFYRDGASGNGRLCLNRYDSERKAWQPLHHPLIDGLGTCNPYWWRPAFGADGSLHLGWCWRDSGDARTNHDICYACSRDGGRTWERSDRKAQTVPITPANAEVADAVPVGFNLINQCSGAVDRDGHPHLAHYHNDDQGIPQYMHLWHDGVRWVRNRVSRRKTPFSLAGGGTLRIPISRPEIAITRRNTVLLITRDEEVGGTVRLYRARPPYRRWEPVDLTHEELGAWEPSYDTVRFAQTAVLSLFLLPVRQGNHERSTDFPPQEAAVLEVVIG